VETECVYCAVRTGVLSTIEFKFSPERDSEESCQ